MNKFTSTSKTNPCPICGKTNGNCRNPQEKLVLCMSFADCTEKYINGYKFIGNDKSNFWGLFILDDGSYDKNSEYAQQKREEYQRYREAVEKAKLEQYEDSLSLQERNKNIKAIVKHLGLSEAHRQELKERGLNDEEIKKGYFATIQPFTELPDTISTRLAGIYIGRNGKPHIGSDWQQGILCPIFNQNGLITGYQIATGRRENKYIWAVTREKEDKETKEIIRQKISSHLPDGELPINFHRCINKDNKTLWLNDGILKTYIAHLLHTIDIVGCAGGNFKSSLNQLLEIIKLFNYNQVIYALDAGDILNRQVMNRLTKLATTLQQEYDINLQFAYWGQLTKSDNDIDEITKLEYCLLDLDKLLEIAKKEQFKAKKRAKLTQLTKFTPHKTFNSQYLAEFMVNIELQKKVTGIKSAMNTGKTYWLKLLSDYTNKPIILIGSRKVLVCNTASVLKIDYCDEFINDEVVKEVFESDNEIEHRIAIVCDSLLKLKDIDWHNAIILIDEAEQFVEHLLLAKTHISKIRGRVLALLAEKLPTVDRILLLDADLSDFTCEYFQQISKLPLQKIENTYQENNRNLYGYEYKDNLIAKFDNSTSNGQNNLIVGDSAQELTAMYHLDIEKGIKSILLTRENLADNKKLCRFLDNNGKAIRQEGIQNVYLSPVGQSGISIEIDDYFDNVFGIFNGAIGTNVARQLLIRDRSKADRHIWVNEYGLGYSTDYDVEKILGDQEFQEVSLINSINYHQQLEGLNFDDALYKVAELRKHKQECYQINSYYRASLIAKNNLMKSDYSAILYDELAQQYYDVIRVDLLTTGNLEKVKEKKEELLIKQSQRTFNAPEIEDSEAEILKNKSSLIESQRDKLLKYRIRQYLPEFTLLTDEFIYEYILKDRWKKLKAINNLYLARNAELCHRLDAKALNYVLWQVSEGGIFWAHDTKQNTVLTLIYESLELDKFIKREGISKDEVIAFREQCKNHRRTLRQLGVKFSDKTYDGTLLNKVFNVFGYRTYKERRRSEDFKIGKIIEDGTLFDNIYQAINLKYSQEIEVNYDDIQALCEQSCQNHKEQELETVNLSDIDINKSRDYAQDLNQDIVNGLAENSSDINITKTFYRNTENNSINNNRQNNNDIYLDETVNIININVQKLIFKSMMMMNFPNLNPLPITYYLLPITYYLLPITSWLLLDELEKFNNNLDDNFHENYDLEGENEDCYDEENINENSYLEVGNKYEYSEGNFDENENLEVDNQYEYYEDNYKQQEKVPITEILANIKQVKLDEEVKDLLNSGLYSEAELTYFMEEMAKINFDLQPQMKEYITNTEKGLIPNSKNNATHKSPQYPIYQPSNQSSVENFNKKGIRLFVAKFIGKTAKTFEINLGEITGIIEDVVYDGEQLLYRFRDNIQNQLLELRSYQLIGGDYPQFLPF